MPKTCPDDAQNMIHEGPVPVLGGAVGVQWRVRTSILQTNLKAYATAPTPIIGSRALIVLTIFDPVWVDALGALKVKVSTLWATPAN